MSGYPGHRPLEATPSPVLSLGWLPCWALLGMVLLGACDGLSSEASRLLIIDGDGNVVTVGADGEDRQVVATRSESEGFVQPVWSPDGSTVAWGQFRGGDFAVGTSDPEGDEVAAVATSALPFYLSWSPDSSRIGVLHQGSPGEIDFVIVDVTSGDSVLADSGTSYYFSWEADAESVVAHIGMDGFDRVGITGESETLGATDADYLAPFVTEAGLFHVHDGNLVLDADPLVGVPGTALFVANPEGTRVAVVSPGAGITVANNQSLTLGRMVVVDLESGELDPVTTTPIAGFYWSPAGDRLLVLTADRSGLITPLVWEAGAGVAEYPQYRPAEAYVSDVLPFFPQYAQSVSFWNRQGTAFAFAGSMKDTDGIWVQHLGADQPNHVSEGSWVTWSP